MKKGSLVILFLIHIVSPLYAQINWGDYSQSFPSGAMDKVSTVALILAIPKANNSFWKTHGNSAYFYDLARDNSFKKIRPANLVARTTFDTARAQFFLHGVNRTNAYSYQFRVMDYPTQNVIVPWKSIANFTDSALIKSAGLPQMAYLGGYKAPLGKMLIVDVRKTSDQQIIATSMVAWESIRPSVSNIYTSANFDTFLKKLQYPWANEKDTGLTQSLDKDLRLPATNTNLIFFLNADIYSKEQIQYQLIRNDQVMHPWHSNEYANSFIWLKDFLPGEYRLRIRYLVQPQHVTEYRFDVESAWYQSIWFKLIAILMGVVVLGLLLFVNLLIRQRRKTQQETANRQKLQLELKALYAQLNPHFVFNALSSIQGLINRQDIKGANDYLSDFARLMRDSLSRKEETSLNEELQTMDTYLKLEQLRFGFQYAIHVDESVNVYTTNVPSLLWQPLLENAVKHGVAALQQSGLINIELEKIDNTLITRISDNGRGFATHEATDGFGLKLTRDRIKLVNELNSEQPISLTINSHLPTGTEVTLIFTHWFI
ncbi:histidine kinase [Spirosoma sp. HMF4905]|uniref:Histidine kinase n=1 Tax=Spirosoma arboris TaxID=2682092 RepID=A0A7K1SJ11_9BACT|nr:histidine kinase [Spirosoma arboris]MVM33809.1 histidine kinase [Spirosoma arboris]